MNEEKRRRSCHVRLYGVSRDLVTTSTKAEKLYGLFSTAAAPD